MEKSLIQEVPFVEADIEIDFIDYYFSNHIARSSTTMNECRSIKNKFKIIKITKVKDEYNIKILNDCLKVSE